MHLIDQYDGSADPFEGDRTIVWRSLPSNAKVTKVTLQVTPVAAPGGTLFEEAITFTNGQGDLGATKNKGTNSVEVDFHKRRTLAKVDGAGTVGANLQADVGGLYVEINDKGSIRVPNDTLFTVPSGGALPGLTVSKFKLTAAAGVNITSIIIRSVPTNLTARLGTPASIWTHIGDLSSSDTSSDFSAVLQTYLAHAVVENGFYVVPVVLHSDTMARLRLQLSVDFVLLADLQPPGIKEVVVPFDFNTLPKTEGNVLSVNLPRGAQVLPGQTTLSAVGAFNGSRIVYGVPAGAAAPPFTVTVSPVESQGQIILPPSPPVAATAVDVLIESLTSSALLTADLRRDLGGKPDGVSLLSKAVEFEVHLTVERQPAWTNVPLPKEFHFENEPYWLVLTSLDGEVLWRTQPAAAGSIGVQHTLDGGFSWHYAGALHTSGPLDASFRLRNTPAIFQIPLHLNVGDGNNSTQVSLDRFQPLGRVDFTLDTSDFSDAMNHYLSASAPPACPQGEHLLNGDFDQWTVAGDAIGPPLKIVLDAVKPSALATSPNGRWTYVAGVLGSSGGGTGGGGVPEARSVAPDRSAVLIINSVCDELSAEGISPAGIGAPLAFAVGAAGARGYLVATGTLSVLDMDKGSRVGTALSSANVAALLSEAATAIDFAGQIVVSANRNVVFFTVTSTASAADKSWIVAISCDLVEEFARGMRVLSKQDITALQIPGQTTVLALSPDETQIYLSLTDTAKVYIVDALSLTHGQPIPVADPPVSVDFTADGKVAVVATSGTSHRVQLIDTASETVTTSLTLEHAPLGLVVSPTEDTAFALLAESEENSLLVPIDLQHMQAGSPVGLKTPGTQMVITPQGDRIYVLSSSDDNVTFVPVGTRTPAEWFVTSDVPATSAVVLPRCLPSHPEMALAFVRHSGDKLVANPVTAGLSQVVPVSGPCSYEFSFLGLSEDEGAVAEIFWLDQNATLLRTDTTPIAVVTGAVAPQRTELAEHLLETTSPAGAAQAEVRFTVPALVRAGLASVALKGTTGALNNTSLEILQGSVPAGWTLKTSARGVTLIDLGTGIGIRLFNAGVNAAELVQSVAIGEKQPFALEFKGRALNPDAAPQQPSVELRWLRSDGTAVLPPTVLKIEASGFLSFPATGNTPAGTASVEIALVAPPETGLEISSVSLQEPRAANVPLSFISQAPGELRVSRSQVTYDVVPAQPPPVPSSGLATPTPPGSKPGDPPCDCYCECCQDAQPITKPKPHVTVTGRPMTVGICPSCGSSLIRPGGPLVPGAPIVRLPVLAVHPPVPARSQANGSPAPILALSDLPGVHDDRLRQLERIGITSLHDLAGASADKIEIQGLSARGVAGLINRARKMISAARPPRALARGGFRWT